MTTDRPATGAAPPIEWPDCTTHHGCRCREYAVEYVNRMGAAPRAEGLDESELIDIIEQAIFETDTGLEAAMLAAERILSRPSDEKED